MKLPKEIRKYCPKCNKHTLHTVKIIKGRKKGGLAFGIRRARVYKKGKGNRGKYSKRAISQWKRVGAKAGSKGVDVRLICKECGKAVVWEIGGRYKRVELAR